MGLRAPARVTVEIRGVEARPDPVRRFRLSRNVGRDGIDLEQPLDLDVGQPVLVHFRLPGQERRLELAGRVAGDDSGAARGIELGDLLAQDRTDIVAYVTERLGLA
jgi:hypothetical protein